MPMKLAKLSSLVLMVLGLLLARGLQGYETAQTSNDPHARLPRFDVDRSWQWPPKLPHNWVVGVVTWVAVDRHDNTWVLHRPRQVPIENKDHAAPPVLEFDAAGRFVQAWGGPGEGYDWGDMEHSVSVDYQDNVWLTFHNPLEQSWVSAPAPPSVRTDDMILKFTSSGKFIKQFGGRDRHPLGVGGNTDTTSVHLATEAAVWPNTNEVFISDGYANRRVLVLDAETLAFKRMWGAFGKQPPPTLGIGVTPPLGPSGASANFSYVTTTDPKGPEDFNSVHAIKISHDGLVYVADRSYKRVQVFTTDGKYVGQVFVNLAAKAYRTACGLAFSADPQQQFIYVSDYENGQLHIVDRKALKQIGSFGALGTKPGEFVGFHAVAVDSKGNLWTAETQPKPLGSRVQRFVFRGIS